VWRAGGESDKAGTGRVVAHTGADEIPYSIFSFALGWQAPDEWALEAAGRVCMESIDRCVCYR